MPNAMSKTQIDRLGDRLRKGNISEDDLRLLDKYRRSFTESYDIVIGRIRRDLGLEPTGRPAKSTTSISDKLRRESIRLTQIQDIAGCRLIVSDIIEQDNVVQGLAGLFEHVNVIDRREKPSHGYRAVHVIADCNGKLIEIQFRTELQHLWAELSEKFSDILDPAIKYGGGDEAIQQILNIASSIVGDEESMEARIKDTQAQLYSRGDLTDNAKKKLAEIRENQNSLRLEALKLLRDTIDKVEELTGEDNDISD